MAGILLYFPIGEAYFQRRTVSFTEGSYNPKKTIELPTLFEQKMSQGLSQTS